MKAQKHEEIVHIADEITQYYKNTYSQRFGKKPANYSSSSAMCLVDTESIIRSMAGDQYALLIPGVFQISSTFLSLQHKSREDRRRIIISSYISALRVLDIVPRGLKCLGLNDNRVFNYGIGIASAAQVIIYSKIHKSQINSVFDLFGRIASVSLINYLSTKASMKLQTVFPRVPQGLFPAILSMISSRMVHQISIYGLSHFKDTFVNLYMHSSGIHTDYDGDLDENVDVPYSLQCSICHGLFKNPVESCGFVFCRTCLSEWLKNAPLHPLTGNPFDESSIEQSKVLAILSKKFFDIHK